MGAARGVVIIECLLCIKVWMWLCTVNDQNLWHIHLPTLSLAALQIHMQKLEKEN